jgi:hypothetical protein
MLKQIRIYFGYYALLIAIEIVYYVIIWNLVLNFPDFFSNISTGKIDELRRIVMLSMVFLPPVLFMLASLSFEFKLKYLANLAG